MMYLYNKDFLKFILKDLFIMILNKTEMRLGNIKNELTSSTYIILSPVKVNI